MVGKFVESHQIEIFKKFNHKLSWSYHELSQASKICSFCQRCNIIKLPAWPAGSTRERERERERERVVFRYVIHSVLYVHSLNFICWPVIPMHKPRESIPAKFSLCDSCHPTGCTGWQFPKLNLVYEDA